MKPLERDAAYLWDMLDAAKQAAELSDGIGLDGLLNDIRTRYAIERALEILNRAVVDSRLKSAISAEVVGQAMLLVAALASGGKRRAA